MTNKGNYYKELAKVNISDMPEVMQKSADLVDKVTARGSNWAQYEESDTIKKVIDLYFGKFDEWVKKQESKSKPKPKPKKIAKKDTGRLTWREFITGKMGPYMKSEGSHGAAMARLSKEWKEYQVTNPVAEKKPVVEKKSVTKKTQAKSKKTTPAGSKKKEKKAPRHPQGGKLVELIDDDVKIIKRYAHFHNKVVNDKQVMAFIDFVQKAIIEKRVRKTSKYAKEVAHIQDQLVSIYNKLINSKATTAHLKFSESNLARYEKIGHSEIKRPSVILLKRYIALDGKKITKEKAEKLIDQMKTAIATGKVRERDEYHSEVIKAIRNLKDYLSEIPEVLTILDTELSGIATRLKQQRFTRSKNKFETARDAWHDIAEKCCNDTTGIRPDEVIVQHTATNWIWRLKDLPKVTTDAQKKK